ncbi:putative VSH-1 protein OrfE [Brachyspira pilosicoli WesB]|uniref:Putative VSH-1 protein OrfE n=1 Tax=Brachyspira pilosicoli WesB TaxID=1161918 RepID=K0JLS8_BRAPL|nr:hypothetical protein [Brachyspira pilosicoli]CCG58087.1 putative VSH-1 protein OrfE [Brachyspira pilosicoli WesB]
MQKNNFKCKEFFNRYIVEETVYKEADNNELMPIKIYSRSTLGDKFNDEDIITINRPTFRENLDYVKDKENNNTDDDIFVWLDVRINDELATSLLDKWSTKDINEFAQVIKSFLLERRAL